MELSRINCLLLAMISFCTFVSANSITTNEAYPGKGIILVAGHELVLQCNNTDNPDAVTSWLKNGNPVNSTDEHIKLNIYEHTLTIKDTTEKDCGNYTCTSAGESAIISVKSAVKLAHVDISRNVVQNQNIVLLCNATQGVPLPSLLWFKDNEPLNTSDPRVELKSDERGMEGMELVIKDARFDDRANYTCVATNDVSSASVSILVRVKDKYAALWPFLGICAEVAILCTIIFIYEKKRQKPDFDESEADQNTENKSVPEQSDKSGDVRQRK